MPKHLTCWAGQIHPRVSGSVGDRVGVLANAAPPVPLDTADVRVKQVTSVMDAMKITASESITYIVFLETGLAISRSNRAC